MKTRLRILKLLLILCSIFATTAVFGQVTYTWTNSAGGDLATAANWNPNGVPNGPNSDTMLFDGQTAGPVTATSNTGAQTGYSGGAWGLNIHLTANQVNSVDIYTTLGISSGLRMAGVTIDSGAGAFSFGDNTGNALDVIWGGVSGQIHNFINNSANPATIYPNVRWRFGGGGTHTLVFDGSGNWNVTNYLTVADGPATVITKSGTGTMTWTGANVPNSAGNSIIASPFTISNGIVVLKSGDLLGTQNIANNGNLLQYDTGNSTVTATTLSGVISGTGPLQVSSGTLTLSGANTYTGGTTISAGTLQVGAGGTSGSFGTGDVTNNGVLVFNRSDSVAFGNVISGAGSVVQYGSGTLTLAGANTYTGATTVSNGTLVVSLVGGDMDVSGGTLVPAAVGSVGTLNVAGSMNISAGTVVATLNRALSPSNSIFSVAGSLNNTAGTLKLLNFGPALAVGDKFTIFNQPVGGAAMTIVSPGFTAANNLAVDGSVTVSSVVPVGSGQITAAVSGGQLNLSWPAAYTGLHLQVQTNSLATGLGTNWVTIPGTDDANSYSNTMNTTNGSVFYRLAP